MSGQRQQWKGEREPDVTDGRLSSQTDTCTGSHHQEQSTQVRL